ncbi:MAG TPA: glutaredoxin family protein [Anaerolineales bacterium]|nr:glutaredoxin family protein [Anaerolineales bacterium]
MDDTHKTTQKLIIYGHDFCGQARQLARVLNEKEIEYEWRDIRKGDPVWQDELRALAKGYLSVPTVIFPDGKVLVEPWPDEVLARLTGQEQSGLLDKVTSFFKRVT